MSARTLPIVCTHFGPCVLENDPNLVPNGNDANNVILGDAASAIIMAHLTSTTWAISCMEFCFLASHKNVKNVMQEVYAPVLSHFTEAFLDTAQYDLSKMGSVYRSAATEELAKKILRTRVVQNFESQRCKNFATFEQVDDEQRIETLVQQSQTLENTNVDIQCLVIVKSSVTCATWTLTIQDNLVADLVLESAMLAPQRYYESCMLRVRRTNDDNPISQHEWNDCVSFLSTHALLSKIFVSRSVPDFTLAVAANLPSVKKYHPKIIDMFPLQGAPKFARSCPLYEAYILAKEENEQASVPDQTIGKESHITWTSIVKAPPEKIK